MEDVGARDMCREEGRGAKVQSAAAADPAGWCWVMVHPGCCVTARWGSMSSRVGGLPA